MCSKTHDRGGESSTPHADLARRAERQHGLLTRKQLLQIGLTSRAIEYKLEVGLLHRVYRGVYAVGHRPPSPLARAMAAVLACGESAVLSHRSAAKLWGIESRWATPLDVTAPAQRSHRGIRVHRSRTLDRSRVTVQLGVPVTTPARTLLDLADVLDDAALTRAVNEARLRCHLRLSELADLLSRSNGRATGRLRPLLAELGSPTRSAFEDAFLDFARRHALPRPDVNQRVAGHEVDMLWCEQRLIVELDGYRFHGSQAAFEQDRRRDADLQATGYRVVRITWQRLVGEPQAEARRLLAMLGSDG